MVFIEIHIKCKEKSMQVIIKQLKDNLKVKNPKCKKFLKNWRELIDRHEILERVIIDSKA